MMKRFEGVRAAMWERRQISAHNQSNTALKYIQCPLLFFCSEKNRKKKGKTKNIHPAEV